MKQIRWLHFSVTASVALLAMVMLTVAPVISGHLTRGDVSVHAQHEQHYAPSPVAQADEAHHGHLASLPLVAGQQQGEPWQKNNCGYCELLIHVPFFLWLFQPLQLFFPRIFWQPITPAVVSGYQFFRLSGYRTRAPPASIWL